MKSWILRQWYFLRSLRGWVKRFNRCVDVENILLDVANKKRPELSREDCRDLAFKLAGVTRGKV